MSAELPKETVEAARCDDQWCGHRWCEKQRAARGEHETKVHVGGTMGLVEQMSYQPRCICGWTGDWTHDVEKARRSTEQHYA